MTDAVRWEPDKKPTEYPDWFWSHFSMHPEQFDEETGTLVVPTAEGTAVAQPGDWLAPDGAGTFRLYKESPKGYQPTEEDAIAFLRRTADAEGFGGWDKVGRVPCSTYHAVARMMLAFRAAVWEVRPCLVCGCPSKGLYADRPDFPTCKSPKCELKMQGGIDAASGSNR